MGIKFKAKSVEDTTSNSTPEDTTSNSTPKDYSYLYKYPLSGEGLREMVDRIPSFTGKQVVSEDDEPIGYIPTKEEQEVLDRVDQRLKASQSTSEAPQHLYQNPVIPAEVERVLRGAPVLSKQDMEKIEKELTEYDWDVGFTTTPNTIPSSNASFEIVGTDPDIPRYKPTISEQEAKTLAGSFKDYCAKLQKQKTQKKSYTDYVLILWPESEAVLSKPWFEDCILMNDKSHLGRIGSSAYFVPKELILNLTKDGKETTES